MELEIETGKRKFWCFFILFFRTKKLTLKIGTKQSLKFNLYSFLFLYLDKIYKDMNIIKMITIKYKFYL